MNALETLSKINTRLKGDYLKLASEVPLHKRVTTGLASMDAETGGGFPLGVPVLLSGPKSSCKSAFCFYMAGRVQEQFGGVPMVFSSEGGFDPEWAHKCGLPTQGCIYFQAEKLTTTLQLFLDTVRNEKPSCIIVDSLTALSADPDASLLDSVSRGERAKPTNEFFRKLGPALDKENPPLIIIIEHLHPCLTSPHGGQQTTGGVTKDYMAVLEMRFRVESMIKEAIQTTTGEAERPVQANILWEIRKNKVAPTGGVGTFSLGLRDTEFCQAGKIDDFNELLAKALSIKAVKKSGAWYIVGEEKYQGLPNFKAGVGPDALREIIANFRPGSGEEECEEDGGKASKRKRQPKDKAGGRRGGKRGPIAIPDRNETHDKEQHDAPDVVVEENQEASSERGEDTGSDDSNE